MFRRGNCRTTAPHEAQRPALLAASSISHWQFGQTDMSGD
jgi:hypothetical protein